MLFLAALSCLLLAAGALAQTLTPDVDCYEGNGAAYKGVVARTNSNVHTSGGITSKN